MTATSLGLRHSAEIVGFSIALISCGQAPAADANTAAASSNPAAEDSVRNVQVVRDFIEHVFNAHDPSAGLRYVQPGFKVTNGFLGVRNGADAYLTAISKMGATFPDLHATIEDAFGSGDRVVLRVTVEGTQRGTLWGISATGKKLRWTGNNIYRLENGKIVEEWASEDWLAVFQQLGQFTPPQTS